MVEDGFGTVYRSVMQNPKICVGAKALYALLCSYSGAKGYCWPKVETMCEDLGIREPTLKQYRKKLVEAGILSIESRRNGNRNGSNIYHLHTPNSLPVKILGGEPSETSEYLGGENLTPEKISPHPSNSHPVENLPPKKNSTVKRTIEKEHYYNAHSIAVQVCNIFNQAKSNAWCKGRLKVETGESVVKGLIDSGWTSEEIKSEAVAYTKAVQANDIRWYGFPDFVNRDGKWRHRR